LNFGNRSKADPAPGKRGQENGVRVPFLLRKRTLTPFFGKKVSEKIDLSSAGGILQFVEDTEGNVIELWKQIEG
jgi:hypothetical protein